MSPAVAGMRGPDIPGFRWVRPLGQGGFADVFLYRQELPSRDVAIKVVRAQGDERGTQELHREADAMTLLAGHPSVVELHGVGTTSDGRAYLVMEYCPVADLLTQVRARPMSLETALDTMIKVCGVVEMFHRQGYVHRDIKPSNIMLDAYGKPVLADFGVASKVGRLEVGAFDGFSVLWAPPEQQDVNSPASPLQDVWALASTTWTFITGRSPFEDPIGDNSAASIANRVQRGRMRGLGRADAPAELERVLRAAMAVDPQERTPSAMEFGQATAARPTGAGPAPHRDGDQGEALQGLGRARRRGPEDAPARARRSSTRIRRACARPRIPSRAGPARAASRPWLIRGRLSVPRTRTRPRRVAWSRSPPRRSAGSARWRV